jgi:hypothetical protein
MSRRIKNSAIWLVPAALIVSALIYHLFVRAITPSREPDFYYGTIPFVPGESYHATGPESR